MKSITTPQFWKHYEALPKEVERRAKKAYELWTINPNAQSLFFKPVNRQQSVYSVRIGRGYRALGLLACSMAMPFYGSGLALMMSMSDC